ncbi:MAG: sugar kinase [Phycisphaerales bacterium]|nr:sugar kinase [Phycisphaerales bacterium]
MQALDVVTFGEAMAMFVADESGELSTISHFTRRMAGAETNIAIGLSRLGLRVGWVSRLGNDSFGQYIQRILDSEGVNCSHVIVDPHYRTGFQLKSKAENGADPIVEYFRKNSAASHLSLADFDRDYFLSARHVHATGITPALSDSTMEFTIHALDFMREAGKTVSFDPNLRRKLWPSESVMIERLNYLASKARWVLPGLSEGQRLTGLTQPRDIAAFYLERGTELVVIKLGPKGAYFRTADDQEGTIPGVPVAHVVDTVGAGDGFAVGVISALLEGMSIPNAVTRGTRTGAFAIQVAGDMEGLPTRAQLEVVERF